MELTSTAKPIEGALIQALGDDRTAVQAFVNRLGLGPLGTERAYAKEVRRLLAWLANADYPVGHTLGTLTTQDMEAFFAFLRSATPLLKEGEPGAFWKKPSPLAATSLEQVRSRLSVFFDMLSNYEVAPGVTFRSGNPMTNLGRVAAVRREPRRPGERVEVEGEEDLEHVLPVEDIQLVMLAIEQLPQETDRQKKVYERGRWVFHLAYYSWLRISELARLQMGDFEFKEGLWQIYVWPSKHAKKGAMIDALPPLMDALAQYRRSLKKMTYPFRGESGPAIIPMVERLIPQSPIKTILRSGAERVEEQPPVLKPLTERAIFNILKSLFTLAAGCAQTEAQRARLSEASPHWLRHSGVTHALNSGMDARYVVRQVRHKNGGRTTFKIYDHGFDPTKRKAQMEVGLRAGGLAAVPAAIAPSAAAAPGQAMGQGRA